jgi:hypothetical protein
MAVYAADRAKALEFTTPKDPSDVIAYAMNFSADIAAGDSIASSTVTAATGLTVDSSAESAGVVSGVMSGGTAGISYDVLYQAVTTNGLTMNYTGIVKVANR